MSWFEIDKMLIVVLKHEFIVPFIIIVGTLSFATGFAAWASLVPRLHSFVGAVRDERQLPVVYQSTINRTVCLMFLSPNR